MPLFIANLGYAFNVNDSFVISDHFKVSWASIINANKKPLQLNFTFTFFSSWIMMHEFTRSTKYSVEFVVNGQTSTDPEIDGFKALKKINM